MGALSNCLSASLYCKPPWTDQASDEGYPSVDIISKWPNGYTRMTSGKKMLFKRKLKRTWGGMDVSRGGKKGRIKVGTHWRIRKSNRAALDLVSLFLTMHHRQETDPMCHADTTCLLSLWVCSAYSIGLMSVPALIHPALYWTPGRPLHLKLSKPTHPTLSLFSLAQVLKYQAVSVEAFSACANP